MSTTPPTPTEEESRDALIAYLRDTFMSVVYNEITEDFLTNAILDDYNEDVPRSILAFATLLESPTEDGFSKFWAATEVQGNMVSKVSKNRRAIFQRIITMALLAVNSDTALPGEVIPNINSTNNPSGSGNHAGVSSDSSVGKSAGKHEFVDLDDRKWHTSDKSTVAKRAKECIHLLRILCAARVEVFLTNDFHFSV